MISFSEVFVLSLRCDTLHNVISFARASVITTIHPCLAFSIRLIFVPASLIQWRNRWRRIYKDTKTPQGFSVLIWVLFDVKDCIEIYLLMPQTILLQHCPGTVSAWQKEGRLAITVHLRDRCICHDFVSSEYDFTEMYIKACVSYGWVHCVRPRDEHVHL